MSGKLHLLRSATRPTPSAPHLEAVSETRQDAFLCTCRPCGKCMEARSEGSAEPTWPDAYVGGTWQARGMDS